MELVDYMTIDGTECEIHFGKTYYTIYAYCGNIERNGHVILYRHDDIETYKVVATCFHTVYEDGLLFDDCNGRLTSKGSIVTIKQHAQLTGKDPVECCVCMEATFQKTKCGHSICRRCTYRLKESICPLCRGGLYEDA